MTTLEQFDKISDKCRKLLMDKYEDYGPSWQILRQKSLTDQLYIKANRIRQLEEASDQRVDDPIDLDYCGLINYSVMAIIQCENQGSDARALSAEELEGEFIKHMKINRDLLEAKNHDYGEVWREMRIESYTDLMLMKLLRVKSIEDNGGKTIISEGFASNFRDIINYSVFALIKLSLKNNSLLSS